MPMTVLEAYLAPLAECFTPDVVRRIVDFRPDVRTEERLAVLRSKANEGTLSESESREYQEFIEVLDFMGLLKAQARSILNAPHVMDTASRRFVRERAGDQCEYCQMPAWALEAALHIEHVLARQHGGGDEVANLALACDRCNFHKGPNISGIDPDSGAIVPPVPSAT